MELKVVGQDRPAAPAAGGGCSSSGCGSNGDQLSHLPEAIRAKVHNHPCYSEDAHHHYARMHVAVAPACNIQCHYCNRKYDCANESRPGVVSELLTPDQAVKKVMAVAASIPQMTVLGIAGPGDPLANPQRTLSTFRQLSDKVPDIKLCVSTNGLALPELVDDLCQHNIDHVTIAQLKGPAQRATRPVLMAVASEGQGMINQHFGHAREFLIYEASATDVRFIGHRKVDLYCSGGDTCGDAETALQKTIRTLDGCEVVLCSKIGFEPWGMLEEAGIMPSGEHAMAPIEEAVAAVYREMVEDGRLDVPARENVSMTA